MFSPSCFICTQGFDRYPFELGKYLRSSNWAKCQEHQIPLLLIEIIQHRSNCSKFMRISTANKAKVVVKLCQRKLETWKIFITDVHAFLKKDPDQIIKIFIEIIPMTFAKDTLQAPFISIPEGIKIKNYFINLYWKICYKQDFGF